MTAGPPLVRRAGASDLDALTRLWIDITHHHASLDSLFQLRPDAEPEIRRLLRAWLRDADTAAFVGELGGRVVGMLMVRVDEAPPVLHETRRAEITDLGVEPAFRRRGLGRRLVEGALAWVRQRDVTRVEVRVATRNAEGQAFWRELGFGDHMDVLERRL